MIKVGSWNHKSCWWHVASPTDGPSLKSVQSRLGISHMLDFEKDLRCLVYSEKFSQQQPWKCESQTNQESHQTANFWGHPSKLGDILPRNLLGITMNHPMLMAITRYQNPQFIMNQCSVSLCCTKDSIQRSSRGSQLPPSTPWRIFLEKNCLRSSTSLWCHSGGTVRGSSVFQKVCFLMFLNQKKWKNMHHVNLCPFCTGRLPALKNNQGCCPQGCCSRDAAACSSTDQGYKDLTCRYSQHMQTESKSWKRTNVLSDCLSL